MTDSGTQSREGVKWQAFPSWAQFSWLYFFVLLTLLRGLIFYRLRISGWELWLAGALVLLVVIVVIRHWALYILTSTKVMIRNGYTRKNIASLKYEMVTSMELLQGPFAKFWNIGTLVIRSSQHEQELRFRGVKDPEIVETKIRALLPMSLSHE